VEIISISCFVAFWVINRHYADAAGATATEANVSFSRWTASTCTCKHLHLPCS